jgi:hypothetical protein
MIVERQLERALVNTIIRVSTLGFVLCFVNVFVVTSFLSEINVDMADRLTTELIVLLIFDFERRFAVTGYVQLQPIPELYIRNAPTSTSADRGTSNSSS